MMLSRRRLASIFASAALFLVLGGVPVIARVPKGLEVCLIETSGPDEQATIRKALYYALSDNPNDVKTAKILFVKAYGNLVRLLLLHCKVDAKDLRSPEVNQAATKYYEYISAKLMEEILSKLRSHSR
jgi:hypothetical protein